MFLCASIFEGTSPFGGCFFRETQKGHLSIILGGSRIPKKKRLAGDLGMRHGMTLQEKPSNWLGSFQETKATGFIPSTVQRFLRKAKNHGIPRKDEQPLD